jgi:DNA invertase Pin-like site-specific DNA recombinase
LKKITRIEQASKGKTEPKKLRVAAYCRVSTDSDEQLESLETQKTHYESYITSRDDWQFAGIYYDEGISGTGKSRRPELERLMQDCKAGKIDMVITKSISRFSRNTTDCLELVRKLLAQNIPIWFEKENINTGSMESELFLSILSSMAADESLSISLNSKWSIKKRFENGTFKISYPPYGYDWDGETMAINPEQAQIVRRIFSETLAGREPQPLPLNLTGSRSRQSAAETGAHPSSAG